MGPGSFDPGNSPKLTTCGSNRPTLQWGRGLLTPEMPKRGPMRAPIHRLQWGRGLLTPEMRCADDLTAAGGRFNGAGVF